MTTHVAVNGVKLFVTANFSFYKNKSMLSTINFGFPKFVNIVK